MANTFATAYDTPDESPGFLLWQVAALWQRHQRAALEPYGLTHTQFVLLASAAWLAHKGTTPTQVQLATHVHTDPMVTSDVLRTLERKGLVQRQSHPTDTRANVVVVTTAGSALVQQTVPVVEQVDRAFFGALGGGLGRLVRSLHILREPTSIRDE
jgi:DNA-binding MarR family transcriptional regulator